MNLKRRRDRHSLPWHQQVVSGRSHFSDADNQVKAPSRITPADLATLTGWRHM
jgi:hypothetical protein